MTTRKFKLGALTIDAQAYGSQGNAILGIRDSGKTYTATEIAEHLFEAGVPFIAFDPTGVWRWLRVPGKGRGYPIVVAGGQGGDLPLTVTGAVEIVRAAMKNGVSLVLDLTDPNLSKSDWKRIVKACVRVLLQENAAHGLRHVFIEEAAEFVPQRVLDGDVYAEVEKLARIGGNARLGYTLINQRSQEVNKAVLELCENLFLHRQRGKNAIQSLDHWLGIAGVDQAALVKSLPGLPSGECWAWMGDREAPVLIKVPPKNSFHPDRRTMHGAKGKRGRKAVDVGSFVKDMRTALVALEAEAAAKDPVKLTAEIAKLKTEKAKLEQQVTAAANAKKPPPDKDALKAAEQKGFDQAKKKLTAATTRAVNKTIEVCIGEVERKIRKAVAAALEEAEENIRQACSVLPMVTMEVLFEPTAPTLGNPPDPKVSGISVSGHLKPAFVRVPPPAAGDGTLTGPQRKLLQSLAWWKTMGHDQPSRPQAAAIAGWTPSGSNLKDRLSELSKLGLVTYPRTGFVQLTPEGEATAPAPDTGTTLIESIRSILTGPQLKLFDGLREIGAEVDRPTLAEKVGWEPNGSNLKDRLSELSRLELVSYPQRGTVALQEWVVEDVRAAA